MARNLNKNYYCSLDFIQKNVLENARAIPNFKNLTISLLTKKNIINSNTEDEQIGSFIFHILFKKFPRISARVSNPTRTKKKTLQQTQTFFLQQVTIKRSQEIESVFDSLFFLHDISEFIFNDSLNVSYSENNTSVSFNYPLDLLLKDVSNGMSFDWPLDKYILNVSFSVDKCVSIEQLNDLIYFG